VFLVLRKNLEEKKYSSLLNLLWFFLRNGFGFFAFSAGEKVLFLGFHNHHFKILDACFLLKFADMLYQIGAKIRADDEDGIGHDMGVFFKHERISSHIFHGKAILLIVTPEDLFRFLNDFIN